jgi:tetratricopeptide (TPR) repeat protein
MGTGDRPEPGPGRKAAAPRVDPEAREIVFGDWLAVSREPAIDAFLVRAARAGDTEAAIAVLNEGLLARPEEPGLYEARAALYRLLGFRRAAERDLEQAVQIAPERAATWYFLGALRQELGLASVALEALARAKALGFESTALRVVSARTNRLLGRRARAAEDYAAALDLQRTPMLDLLLEVLDFVEERRSSPEQVYPPLASPPEPSAADPQALLGWSIALRSALQIEAFEDPFERTADEPERVAGPTTRRRRP